LSTVLAVGVIFPLLPITFVHTFRTGETDGLLLLLLTLSAFLLWRSLERPWLVVAAAATVGLAFMTKSVAAGVVPIAFGVVLLLTKQWPYRRNHAVSALAVFLAVVLPWHLHQLVTHGQKFWDEYVGFHIVRRVEERLHVTPKQHGPFWYLTAVQSGMFPWAWLLVPALAAAVVRARRYLEQRLVEVFLVSWGVGTVVLFSLAATKLAWYIAPAYPALTMLVARFITEPFVSQPRWLRWLTAAAVVGYLWRFFQLYRSGVSGLLSLNFLDPRLAVMLVVIAVVVLLGWAYRRSLKTGRLTLRVIVALLLLHMALASLVLFSRNVRRTYESSFRVFRNAIEAVAVVAAACCGKMTLSKDSNDKRG
jgi:4-amino-4-deoxy-L-arabinose transferase-like glycosyltransferase